MPRGRSGPGAGARRYPLRSLATFLLLLPALSVASPNHHKHQPPDSAPQQHLNPKYDDTGGHAGNRPNDTPSKHEDTPADAYTYPRDTYTASVSTLSRATDAKQKPIRRSKNPERSESLSERALATLAPAASKAAVRDPNPATNTAGGLGRGRHAARSLRDWEVEDFVLLATVDGTLHARSRSNGAALWQLQSERPMVDTVYHNRNKSNEDGAAVEQELYWIVEPSQDGSLYIYSPGPNSGMQRLGLTVKKLAEDLSPWSDNAGDPAVVYTAEKRNTLYTIDAGTGRVVQMFSASGPSIPNLDRCEKRNKDLSPLEEEECDKVTTFTLGKTEYIVRIQNGLTSEEVCTIRYFEWSPNNRDRDLHSQYSTTMDNKYVYSRHDGNIFVLDNPKHGNDPRPVYHTKFPSPVVRVFDVARQTDQEQRDSQLVLLPQPIGPPFGADDGQDIFVNCTEAGSFYAMSESRYPSVTDGATKAKCYAYDWADPYPLDGPVHKTSAIVGVHSLADVEVLAKDVPLISPGVTEPVEIDPLQDAPEASVERVEPWLSASVLRSVVVLILFGVLGISYVDPRIQRSVMPLYGKYINRQTLEEPLSPVKAPIIVDEPADGLDTTEEKPERRVRFEVDELTENGDANQSEFDPTETADAKSLEDKEGSPIEPGEGEVVPEVPKKKKAHRGQRGGAKRRRSKKRAEEELAATEAGTEAAAATSTTTNAADGNEEVPAEEINAITTRGPPIGEIVQINNMTMDTSQLLGSGSGGTFVFGGTFEGRSVAVKRMLPQFFELASQEVSLLQESDDHPNVIRYYCQQHDQNFLYIAVELCQASLWDLYRDGRRDETLSDTFNQLTLDISAEAQKVLYQLAAGLNHLHSLRIMHRDIKPQNILIAYPKKNSPTKIPRLVISDFGLCKTLPENVSTLVGTTGNAGTVGWKAPELISKPKDFDGGKDSSTGDVMNQDTTSSGDGNTSSGIKRSIDIFSLGCVFFYVLTNGSHPFDDDEGWMQVRELNIKKDRINLSKLYGPDSVEPAHLIAWMLKNQPEDRPTAVQVMAHPFFWSAEKRLAFLCDASDHWEREPRDPPSYDLETLELYAPEIIPSGDFLKDLDRKFVETLGKQRKYTGTRVLDLLRALRNKKNHYEDMPEDVKARVGPLPEGYLSYWTIKFPNLIMSIHAAVRDCQLEDSDRFRSYFEPKSGP